MRVFVDLAILSLPEGCEGSWRFASGFDPGMTQGGTPGFPNGIANLPPYCVDSWAFLSGIPRVGT